MSWERKSEKESWECSQKRCHVRGDVVLIVDVTRILIAIFALVVAGAGCSSSRPSATEPRNGTPTTPSPQEPPLATVNVTRVRAFITDGRLRALAQGELGDGCTSLHSVQQARSGNDITLTLKSVRRGEICTMILQLLNEWVPLDGTFEPGDYTLRANAATIQFRLVRDGSGALRIEPDPGPAPK